MYVTAQLVQTRDRAGQAINTVAYSHKAGELPILPDGTPDVATAALRAPGTLMAAISGLTPGGNSVLAWLDVAAPDGLNPDKLSRALVAGAGAYPGGSLPVVWALAPIALRFNALPLLQPHAAQLLRDLKDELLWVFGSGVVLGSPGAITPTPNPLGVLVRRDAIGTVYSLSKAAAAPLRSLPTTRGLQLSVMLPYAQRDRVEAVFGNVYAKISELLTGLTLDQINALAGILFLDDDGSLLWDSRV